MIKSFKQYLSEMPLPIDWDKTKMGSSNSFASQLKYARQRAKQIGAGSSRVAFVIPYEGRKTVLKIAKNQRGLAQNEVEASMLSDSYIIKLNITIPLIDYDEKSDKPSWVHTEFATKATQADFTRHFGMNARRAVYAAEMLSGRTDIYKFPPKEVKWKEEKLDKLAETNEEFASLVDLVGSYSDLPLGDLARPANWGIYNNRLVLVDMGVTNEILRNFY